MTLAERTIKAQREELKQVHNTKFERDGLDFRLQYEGGVAEYISIYGRRHGEKKYKYVGGFSGYKFYSKDHAIAMAKGMVENDFDKLKRKFHLGVDESPDIWYT